MRQTSAVLALALCLGMAVSRPGGPAIPEDYNFEDTVRNDSPLEASVSRSADPPPRTNCQNGVNTSSQLAKLRALMEQNGLAAYIIPSGDEHGSEYTGLPDRRREFMSGFTGSVGDGIVTKTKAVLWLDSRYYLQAERELDCNWSYMKKGQKETPSLQEWLVKQLGKNELIGADPKLVAYGEWSIWEKYFIAANGPRLQVVNDNLVDLIWGSGKPSYFNNTLEEMDIKYTGMSWQQKVQQVWKSMQNAGGDLLVLSALDDCAWLLNLRGTEIPYTPVFRCYTVVSFDAVHVFLPLEKTTEMIRQHLHDDQIKLMLYPHNEIWNRLPALASNASKVLLTQAAVYHKGSSYKLYQTVPSQKVKFIVSPVLYLKAKKTPAEAAGMKTAHIKDAVALVQMLALLAEEVPAGKYWDEITVTKTLEQIRGEQKDSRGPSFETISAFGINSALPHYIPSNDTNLQLTTKGLFMLDSGGQYLDGTTDVTRTVHWGTPTEHEIDVYTRLLKGCIDLASLRFPKGRSLQTTDILLRAPLYNLGLQYGHGSTHGIGSYLIVHESFDYVYHENFFGSQEPGYYEKGKFGMRLENIVQVVPANVTFKTGTPFFEFETITLVPYERKLINTTLLNPDEMTWLNNYNKKIRNTVGPELLKQNKQKAYRWLMEQTQPFC